MSRDYNVWVNKRITETIIPHLGSPENVFSGDMPRWMPQTYKAVLDCGCGVGIYHDFLTRNGARYVGLDSSPHMLEVAMAKYPYSDFQLADITEIPFSGNTFGLVWANAVLIHMPFDVITATLSEMRRVSSKWISFNAYVRDDPEDYVLDLDEIGILNVVAEEKFKSMIAEVIGNVREINIVSDDTLDVGTITARCIRYLITKR